MNILIVDINEDSPNLSNKELIFKAIRKGTMLILSSISRYLLMIFSFLIIDFESTEELFKTLKQNQIRL